MKTASALNKDKKVKSVSYAKWGYIFIIPFFVAYIIFTFIPQIKTVLYSFTEYYEDPWDFTRMIGPNIVYFQNYADAFKNVPGSMINCLGNTVVMWLICAIPQFTIALLLAVIFTSTRLNIKGQAFFKTVFYLPNLIMASAFALLFYQLFDEIGAVNQILAKLGWIDKNILFLQSETATRLIIGFINFLMWFGNTMILLMAGIQSIDESLIESARLDGAGAWHVFKDITMPLLKPIFVYVLITSLIGGIQMFDVPQILTNGFGSPNFKTMTMVMSLSAKVGVRDYGRAGAVSVILFMFTFILSMAIYKTTDKE